MLGCYTIPPTILTPHVLSEWMVEVCRFEYLGIVLGSGSRFELVGCSGSGCVLTPHVLSDGNVEWCSFISMCSCFELVF